MRKLASIQRITNKRPIPGADLIEAIDVLGWTVVSQKGVHEVGDLVIYFEVDSFLNAEDPRYASFEERFTNWGNKRGMRLKTIKLRGQLSQGLILPIREFKEVQEYLNKNYWQKDCEGVDVTEILKIEKWESLSEQNSNNGGGMGGKAAGAKPFPSFIRKTDQERVQNYIAELPRHKDETFEVTIKLDGSSMTIFRIDNSSPHFKFAWSDIETRKIKRMGKVARFFYKIGAKLGFNAPPEYLDGLCSRNIQLDVNDSNHFSEVVRRDQILEKLAAFGKNIAVQGELIGPSIQENHEKVSGLEFYVFDIFDIDAQQYLLPEEARDVTKKLGLKHVPVLNMNATLDTFGTMDDARGLVDKILEFAEGAGMNYGVRREGVVFKSNTRPFSFKAISNSYLLKKAK